MDIKGESNGGKKCSLNIQKLVFVCVNYIDFWPGSAFKTQFSPKVICAK